MDNLKKKIDDINQKYKPLIMPEEIALNDQSLSVDMKILHNIPKSPKKLPKLKADLGSGNWKVSKIKSFQVLGTDTYLKV